MRPITLVAVAIATGVLTLASTEADQTWAQDALGPQARSPFNPPSDDDAPPPLPLAAGGYCVVTLHDHQQWKSGDRRLGGAFDGREYLFAGPRERAIFAAAPEKYLPALNGDCIVTYAETGERVAGKVQFGALRGGRLYFMADDQRLRQFTADSARYVDADMADGGRCPVKFHDEHRSVPGIPATATTFGGLRYFFASAHERSAFVRDPLRYAPGGPAREAAPGLSAQANPDAERDGPESAGEGAGGEDMAQAAQPLMDGYCPVTIRQTGVWARGRYDYRVEFGPLLFLTAGPAEHDALMQDPARYVPAIGGDCVVSLVDEGRRVRGSIFHAAEYQERLYLFADAQRKAAFKADPAHYALIDVAAGGACVVTQRDAGRDVPGSPKFAAWHDGLVYRFAGAAELKKFRALPERYAVESPAILNPTAADSPPEESAPEPPVAQPPVAQ